VPDYFRNSETVVAYCIIIITLKESNAIGEKQTHMQRNNQI